MANIEGLLPLGSADIQAACELVAEAGWNQNAADWRIFLELGSAIAVKAPDGRLAATAATLPYPSGFGWISMVLVTSAFRRRGIATALLQECISRLVDAGRIPVLDATPAGREVYKPLGFRDGWPLQRWRRRLARHFSVSVPVKEIRETDWPAVLALDAAAFGCDRSPLLERLRERSAQFACVIEERGFLLGRDGRIATHLGPIVAEDEISASALVGHFL